MEALAEAEALAGAELEVLVVALGAGAALVPSPPVVVPARDAELEVLPGVGPLGVRENHHNPKPTPANASTYNTSRPIPVPRGSAPVA